MKTMIGQVGKSFPLGATLVPGGANFSVYAKHSTAAQLLLFDDADAPRPSRVIDLDPRTNRTYHYWHVFVPDVIAGQAYAYRVAGQGRTIGAKVRGCEHASSFSQAVAKG